MTPNVGTQQSTEIQVPHGRSPAITTTCHLVDDCAICNMYADHFDVTSLMARLDPADSYTRGLHQGIALHAHETDSLVSRYRSRLASSHLKMQTLQSESTERQLEVQSLHTQATRHAMEIELLKRELAIERDRLVALESACDDLQVELADERRKTINGSGSDTNTNLDLNAQWQDADEQDWIWDWDDDWETYEKEDVEERTGPSATSTIDTTTTIRDSGKNRDQSPSDEDWGWVHDIPLSNQNAGFYWEDFQESPIAEAGYVVQDPSSSDWALKGLARVGVRRDNNSVKVSNAEDRPRPALSSLSKLSLPYDPRLSSAHGSPGISIPSPMHELTIKQITDLISVASSDNVTTDTSISSTHTPESALIRIRALIQQAERTPRNRRSEAQVWLLANWRRPSPSSRPQSHPQASAPIVILLKAPTHPTLDLPDVPEIYVDASETGVGFYFPFSSGPNPSQWLAYRWSEGGHPSILLGAKRKIVITWAELIAVEMGIHVLRALGYGLDDESELTGPSARSVGDGISTDPKGKSCVPDPSNDVSSPIGTDGVVHEHPLRRARLLIRSDNLGVVLALSSLASPNPKVSFVHSQRLWPSRQALDDTAQRILRTCELYKMQLNICWVPSKQNLADGPSRASWAGKWNSRSGKSSSTSKEERTSYSEEMLDWDVLRSKTSMERVPEHLRGCLKPVGGGIHHR